MKTGITWVVLAAFLLAMFSPSAEAIPSRDLAAEVAVLSSVVLHAPAEVEPTPEPTPEPGMAESSNVVCHDGVCFRPLVTRHPVSRNFVSREVVVDKAVVRHSNACKRGAHAVTYSSQHYHIVRGQPVRNMFRAMRARRGR